MYVKIFTNFRSSGTYDIYVKIDGEDKKVGSYDNQGSFGELALMYNMPRAATIVATSDGTLWAMVRTLSGHGVMAKSWSHRWEENISQKFCHVETFQIVEKLRPGASGAGFPPNPELILNMKKKIYILAHEHTLPYMSLQKRSP